jgi:multidrug transporter EmrE-like cation transporter
VLHIIILPFANLVLLSVGPGFAIIYGTLLSICFLKEKFDKKRDGVAILLIIAGCVMTVATANKTKETYTIEQLKEIVN